MLSNRNRNIPLYTKYIVSTDASDDACRTQLLQEHDGMEFPVAFLSHTFTETQRNGGQPNRKSKESIMQ